MLKDLQNVEHVQCAADVHPYLLPSVICCWIHTQMKEIKTWETPFPISPVNRLSSRIHCCDKNKYFLHTLNLKDDQKFYYLRQSSYVLSTAEVDDYKGNGHNLWFTMARTSLSYFTNLWPSLKMGCFDYSCFSKEMNSDSIYKWLLWVLNRAVQKIFVRCIAWAHDLSLSWVSVSQIEILSPQFTVTAEAKESWWIGDWYAPLSICLFHTRILELQYSPESSRNI